MMTNTITKNYAKLALYYAKLTLPVLPIIAGFMLLRGYMTKKQISNISGNDSTTSKSEETSKQDCDILVEQQEPAKSNLIYICTGFYNGVFRGSPSTKFASEAKIYFASNPVQSTSPVQRKLF